MTPKTILYVEDEENDVLLFQLASQQAGLSQRLHVACDGQEALAYLAGTGSYADRHQHPLPDLILLDLNLPCLSGMQVLQWLRQQPQFAALPVVIYTSSDHPRDRENAQQFGATDYVLKPSRIEQIAQLARRLHEQWLTPAAPALAHRSPAPELTAHSAEASAATPH